MTPVRTIAVGFDGSAGSRNTLGWAAELAEAVEAEIAVVHAVGLLEHASDPGLVAELEEEGSSRRPGTGHGATPAPVVSGRWRCLLGAHPIGPTADRSRSARGRGQRGRGGHSGLLLGSTSHELAEHSPIPVVIVPLEEPR